MAIVEENTITGLEENEFELPIGYTDKDGILHKTFTLREMTGEVDEKIAEKKIRSNAGKIVTEAIYGVVETLGSLPRLDRNIIRQLSTVDRDYILLMNYKYSLDEEIQWEDNCPYCPEKIDATIAIDKIPVKFMTKDEKRLIEVTLPLGIRGEEGKRFKELVMTFPNGMVQEKIFNTYDKNPAEAITQILAMCTEEIKGLGNYQYDVFKKLAKKDRNHINKELNSVDVGAELNIDIECTGCGAEFKSPIPLMKLLGE